jgi:N-acyl amino acid synthase of PEP-CTERM/exosortase system
MSPHFTGLVLDDLPHLLNASYALRYQVYCLERGFLPPENYPDQIEMDEFDEHSIHMGVVNARGELAATARLVQLTVAGLPSFDHCTFYSGANVLGDLERRVIEISRLAVSRTYNRRAGDAHFSLEGATIRPDGPERRGGGELVMTLYKAIYQVSKRRGISDWMAATEKSLHRLISRNGFPFRQIGPQTDYYGPVSPYLLNLAELDDIISSHRFTLLDTFPDGLEPAFKSRATDASSSHSAL